MTTPLRDPNPALPIKLRRGKRSDLPALTSILCEAFLDDELNDHTMPGRRKHPHQYRLHYLRELRLCFALPTARFLLATYSPPESSPATKPRSIPIHQADEEDLPQEGEILGFGVYAAMGESHLADTWGESGFTWSTALEAALLAAEEWYAKVFANRVADYRIIGRLEAAHVGDLELPRNDPVAAELASADGEQGLLRLMVLATLPKWQGRGVGKALVQWGMRTARAEGLPLTLAGSLTGREFYEKQGFKTFRWDVVEGHDEKLELPNMLWEPDQYRGRWLEEDGNGWKIKGK